MSNSSMYSNYNGDDICGKSYNQPEEYEALKENQGQYKNVFIFDLGVNS